MNRSTQEASKNIGTPDQTSIVIFCLLNQAAESETEIKDFPTYNQLSKLVLFLVAIKCVFKIIAMQVVKISSNSWLQA